MSIHELHKHYESGVEVGRLFGGHGRIERDRTQAIISRYLPSQSAVIYDIGGGAGAYAVWLLQLGHSVHLLDPVPLHVEQAKEAMVQAAIKNWTATLGDARSLNMGDESADVVLLLGPLYHLTDRADRVAALREAYRVLRPNGIMFASAISQFASLLDGMTRGLLDDPTFRSIVEQDLIDGQHRNPTGDPKYFTTAYFHRPEDLRAEVQDAGFAVKQLSGIEGPAWIVPDIANRWDDESHRQLWMKLIERVENEDSLMGASIHFLTVGIRQ